MTIKNKSAVIIPFNKKLNSEKALKCSFCKRPLDSGKDVILEGIDGAIMCIDPCGKRFKKLMEEQE